MTALPDITSPEVYAESVPLDRFRWLRHNAPVSFHEEPDGGAGHWALVRYDDVVAAGRDWRRFSSARGSTLEEMTDPELDARRSIMDMDPPAHTRLRRLLSPGYTPRVVAAYETAFRLMTKEMLAGILGTPGDIDLVTTISKPIPAVWLAEHLGVPIDKVDDMVRWSDRMLMGGSDPDYAEDRSDPRLRFAPFGSPAGEECFQYASELAADRRAHPRDDLITQVLNAEPGGEPLTDDEFKNFFAVLMIAGQEASRHSISSGTLALLEQPDAVTRIREEPDLIDTATEEILRWSTPIYHFRRTTTEPVELHGISVPAGAKVTLWYISANFDERIFEGPMTFDIARSPNNHVAFGKSGPHHCLGASLGRLQVKVTIQELLPYLDRITLIGPVVRLQSNLINGIKHMPVHVG